MCHFFPSSTSYPNSLPVIPHCVWIQFLSNTIKQYLIKNIFSYHFFLFLVLLPLIPFFYQLSHFSLTLWTFLEIHAIVKSKTAWILEAFYVESAEKSPWEENPDSWNSSRRIYVFYSDLFRIRCLFHSDAAGRSVGHRLCGMSDFLASHLFSHQDRKSVV